jgi:gamma-glutamylcyclotransferase (GGCT)/AIG2-like uncharacterized protein YtfP
MNEKIKIAVYGTLKKGFANHSLIATEDYLGNTVLSDICLYDIGPYPGARKESSSGVLVEVYAVRPEVLLRLDVLEEYDPTDPGNSLYTRELFPSCFGAVWVYLYQAPVDEKSRQSSGVWGGNASDKVALNEDTE